MSEGPPDWHDIDYDKLFESSESSDEELSEDYDLCLQAKFIGRMLLSIKSSLRVYLKDGQALLDKLEEIENDGVVDLEVAGNARDLRFRIKSLVDEGHLNPNADFEDFLEDIGALASSFQEDI